MDLSTTLNINGVKESLDTAFNNIENVINNATSMKSVECEIRKYFEEVKNLSKLFVLDSNAGNTIRQLYMLTPIKQVKCKDFVFGVDQYEKYLEGMNNYIRDFDNKSNNGLPTEMVDSFNTVIGKDEDFIKMLFMDETGSIQSRPCSIVEGLNMILSPITRIDEYVGKFQSFNFEEKLSHKLLALSTVRFVYYLLRGAMNSVVDITNEVSGNNEKTSDEPIYSVF